MKTFSLKTIVLIFFFSPLFIVAQTKKDSLHLAPKINLKDRIYFGGSFGVLFGNNYTLVEISPLVGYRITENLSGGVGMMYRYSGTKNERGNQYSITSLGERVFLRYNIFESFYLYAEDEYSQLKISDFYNKSFGANVNSLYVGGGYRQSLGGRMYLNLLVLWNLTPSPYTPYINPGYLNGNLVIRGGVTIGL